MTCCKDKTYVEVWLPYFKQGDDLAHCLDVTNTPTEAMNKHAEMLRVAAEVLENVGALIYGHEVKVDADTHLIGLSLSKDLSQTLVDAKLAHVPEYLDEIEDEECCGRCGDCEGK